MRPKLTFSLMALVAAVAMPVMAAYDGGPIVNTNDSAPGTPIQAGDITVTLNAVKDGEINMSYGAVELSGRSPESGETGGSNMTTTLEGNIHLISGKIYENEMDMTVWNHGVYIAADGEGDPDNPYPVDNGNIILKTAGASDKIVIDTYGRCSTGVWNRSTSSTVILDASNSTEGIFINQNTAHETNGSHGIISYGQVDVLGKLTITGAGNDFRGLLSQNGGTITTTDTTVITATGAASSGVVAGTTVTVEGATDVTGGTYGLIAGGTGGAINLNGGLTVTSTTTAGVFSQLQGEGAVSTPEINIKGDVSIQSSGIGVYAQGGSINMTDSTAQIDITSTRYGMAVGNGSQINIAGSVTVNSSSEGILIGTAGGTVRLEKGITMTSRLNGFYAQGGTFIANAPVDITSQLYAVRAQDTGRIELKGASNLTGNGYAIYASNGGTVIGSAAQYMINSDIGAVSSGEAVSQVSLSMASASRFTGKTVLTGNSTLDLGIAGQSQWTVMDNSTLTSLTLDGTSWLSFNLLDADTMTFANINATSIALADGAVLQLMGVKSTDFETLGRALTSFNANLLNAGTLSADGVTLVTADNYELTFTNNADGTFTVTGVTGTQLFIPEPATATLGLLGLSSLLLRRRKR